MIKQIELPSLASLGIISTAFKSSQFGYSDAKYFSVATEEFLYFLQMKPLLLITKIPNKVSAAIPHQSVKGQVVLRSETSLQIINAIEKLPIASTQLSNEKIYFMKFIDEVLFLVTQSQVISYDSQLKTKTVIASCNDMFSGAQQVVVSAFSGNIQTKTYLLSAVVVTSAGQQLRTLLVAGSKSQVIPDIVSSAVSSAHRRSFVTTSLGLMADFKNKCVKSADLLALQDKVAMLEPQVFQLNADEVCKYIISNEKLGVHAIFTNQQRLVVLDAVYLKILIELKTQSSVVAAACSDSGFLYVQQDGRIFEAQVDVDILYSTASTKLNASELYSCLFATKFYNNLPIYFVKTAKPYLDYCIQNKKFGEVAEIVADSLQFKQDELRGCQLIDKISLSGDKTAFKLYAATLVQKRQVKLTKDEQIAVIKQLHQEQNISAFLKFYESDLLEYEVGSETVGNLFIELAGIPAGKEYSQLALLAFQKNSCHLRVFNFYLKNGGMETALKYLKQGNIQVDFDFIGHLQQQYGMVSILKGDQKYNCQQDAQKLLVSDVLPINIKEQLIMEVCAPLDMGQAVIQYLNNEMKSNNSGDMQTLFVKSLIITAGANLQKVKYNLLTVLVDNGPLSKANKQQIGEFAIKHKMFDISFVIGLMSGQIYSGQKLQFDDVDYVKNQLDKLTSKAQSETFVKEIVGLMEIDASDNQIMLVFVIICACLQNDPEKVRQISKADDRLYLEVFRKFAYTNFMDEYDELFKLMYQLIILKEVTEDSGRTSLKGIYEHIIRTNMETTKIFQLSDPLVNETDDDEILTRHAHVLLFPFITNILRKVENVNYYEVITPVINKLKEKVKMALIRKVFVEKYGYPSVGQTPDKFNHIGSFELIEAFLKLCLKEKLFEECQQVLVHSIKHLNVSQTFSIFSLFNTVFDDLSDSIACIQCIVDTTVHEQVKHTVQLEINILKAINGQIITDDTVQQNMLDQQQLFYDIQSMKSQIFAHSDNLIAPLIKIFDTLAMLQIAEANSLFIDYVEESLEKSKSDTILKKIIDICLVKQEQSLWVQICKRQPDIVVWIQDLSIPLSGQPALTFAISVINVDDVDFKVVKNILKQAFDSDESIDHQFALNIMLQISVKIGDEDQLLLDIKKNSEAVTASLATLASSQNLQIAAATIYKTLNQHVDSITCLLSIDNVELAKEFCQEMKSAQAWRVLCNYWIQKDQLENAFDSLEQTGELTLSCDLARLVFKNGSVDLNYKLSQYMLDLRKDQADKYIDNDLALLLAVCMHSGDSRYDADVIKGQLAQLLCDQQSTCNPQKLGDSCFIRELYTPARLFFIRAENYIAVNAVCLKLHDYLGAVKASLNQNTREIWRDLRAELLSTYLHDGVLDQTKLLFVVICSLNLFGSSQDIVEFMGIECPQLRQLSLQIAADLLFGSPRSEFAANNIGQIGTTLTRLTKDMMENIDDETKEQFVNLKALVINPIHSQLLNVYAGVLAKLGNEELLPYLKKFHKLLDLQFVASQCEKLENLAECLVFCQVAQGNIDGSISTILKNDGDVAQLLKLLSVTSLLETHARALKFSIEKHPEILEQQLVLAIRVMSPAQIAQMTQIAAEGMTTLYKPYFVKYVIDAETPVDDKAVNSVLISYLKDQNMVVEMQKLVSKVSQFERQQLADELAQIQDFHYAAATIYNKINQAPKAIKILLEDNLISEAISEVQKSQHQQAGHQLLQFVLENCDDDQCMLALEVAGHLQRLDVLLALCHSFKKFDLAMPFIIKSVGALVDKVEGRK